MHASDGRLDRSGYIPSLDGWRALAVLSVISVHDTVYKIGPFSTEILHTEGYRGVNLFFAISGILICTRLLEEERRFGKISLRGFYIRRACRILPAAFVFLLTVTILALCRLLPLTNGALASAVFFFRNYYPFHGGITDATLFTNHFWSLSLEEHFYLLFPLFLTIVVKSRAAILGAAALLLALWNWLVTNTPSLEFGPVPRWRTDLSLNEILIPALIAIIIANPQAMRIAAKFINPWSALPFSALLAFVAQLHLAVVSMAAAILIYPLLLLGTVLQPQAVATRILELPPVRFVGRISFSLYLWQQLLFTGSYSGPSPLGVLVSWPWRILLLFALATLSYTIVEKPMMRLGHRLAPPATPGRSDLVTGAPTPV